MSNKETKKKIKQQKVKRKQQQKYEDKLDRVELLLMKKEKNRVRRESSMPYNKRQEYFETGELGGLSGTFQSAKHLTGIEIVVTLLVMFFVNMGGYYFISKNLLVSLIVGLVGMVYVLVVFTIPNRKLSNYQRDLNDLYKYVMNMTFYLSSGKNVMESLRSVEPLLKGNVQKDVQILIRKLEKASYLDATHFEKYNFKTLDQFHHNLNILYTKGGDSNTILKPIQHNMEVELRKRDELYRKRKGMTTAVMVLIGMVVGIIVVISLVVGELWSIFLSYTIASNAILLLSYTGILYNMYLLQRHNKDISVRR